MTDRELENLKLWATIVGKTEVLDLIEDLKYLKSTNRRLKDLFSRAIDAGKRGETEVLESLCVQAESITRTDSGLSVLR